MPGVIERLVYINKRTLQCGEQMTQKWQDTKEKILFSTGYPHIHSSTHLPPLATDRPTIMSVVLLISFYALLLF